MFEEYADILTVEECCEALRVGYNAITNCSTVGNSEGIAMDASGGFPKQH